VTVGRLLEGFEPDERLTGVAAYPAVAVKDGVRQVHPVAVLGIALAEVVENLPPTIPDRTGDEIGIGRRLLPPS